MEKGKGLHLELLHTKIIKRKHHLANKRWCFFVRLSHLSFTLAIPVTTILVIKITMIPMLVGVSKNVFEMAKAIISPIAMPDSSFINFTVNTS